MKITNDIIHEILSNYNIGSFVDIITETDDYIKIELYEYNEEIINTVINILESEFGKKIIVELM